MQDAQAARLTLAQAAARLGVAQDTVRRRIKRGELTAERDNRGRYIVLLPPMQAQGSSPSPLPAQPDAALVAELRARIESLERRLDGAEAERRRLAEALVAEVERRRWPGLRRWFKRVWEGDE